MAKTKIQKNSRDSRTNTCEYERESGTDTNCVPNTTTAVSSQTGENRTKNAFGNEGMPIVA